MNHLEESSGRPEFVVATLPKSEQMVFMSMNGRLHEDHLSQVIDTAVKGCKDVHDIIDSAVRAHVTDVSVKVNT